ncbi:A/G-specific adenine glycosylase [Falsigemmobacter faecalis]|uniref:Adenine DNA glycosylase n=1 Tax=Falsigemmobacter faecalis TaxID=2488730 RepID=A0A3P3DI55_9RHOB|nr:A/G-specific adenine glycosylase [Falsigemmobacter faecalis]RRH73893.1 A/G-specific adenine glycosylase [Falsigemmobacter faecalis]
MCESFAEDLLAWYDRHARELPWRISPADHAKGLRPDPYRIWLSEVMLQQTTVAAVKDYFNRFTTRWPDVAALAAAPDAEVMAEWAGLGYYARARNLLACARVVADAGGFPQTEAGLLTLPGVGPYTAAAIASIAFATPAVVVDGNVERVTSRIFAMGDPLPAARPKLRELAAQLSPQKRPGDYAQAMMDLGATICTPRNPACTICPVFAHCEARRLGIAADLPRKTPKAAKPERAGVVYIARRPSDGAWLIETRPDKGLLGGMPGFPGSDWAVGGAPAHEPPLAADWLTLNGEVRHTFTHFHLTLQIRITRSEAEPQQGAWRPAFSPAALPTVMRKAWDLAAPQFHDV